ncbi:sigma-54-dependent transcriptional regulator [Pseudomonas sp. SH1-B]
MLEAVSGTSRHVLVLEPIGTCEALLAPLQDVGWSIRFCKPGALAASTDEVVLFDLHEQPIPTLLAQLRRTRLCCVALVANPTLIPVDINELVGEWFFAAFSLPVDVSRLSASLQQAQAGARLLRPKDRKALQFLGNRGQARNLRKQLDEQGGRDGPLLIRGERGSGKHLLAQLLHERAACAKQQMICVDAAELSRGLFDQSGHSATLAAAAATSLLIENITALSGDEQLRLLRCLQAQPSLRLITLNQGELEDAVQQNRFHSDLYRLLSARQLTTPALSEQPGDLLLLAEHFARRHGAAIGRQHRRFSDEAVAAMTAYDWPGNVRELRHRLLRAMALAQGRQILPADLGLDAPQALENAPVTLEDYILRAERQALNDVLGRYTHNMSQAARTLGVSRPTFYRLLHKHRLR